MRCSGWTMRCNDRHEYMIPMKNNFVYSVAYYIACIVERSRCVNVLFWKLLLKPVLAIK
jgi:hypothetical protein